MLELPYDVERYRFAALWFRSDGGNWWPLDSGSAGLCLVENRKIRRLLDLPDVDEVARWRSVWWSWIRALTEQGRCPAVVLLPAASLTTVHRHCSPDAVPHYTFRGPELRLLFDSLY